MHVCGHLKAGYIGATGLMGIGTGKVMLYDEDKCSPGYTEGKWWS